MKFKTLEGGKFVVATLNEKMTEELPSNLTVITLDGEDYLVGDVNCNKFKHENVIYVYIHKDYLMCTAE